MKLTVIAALVLAQLPLTPVGAASIEDAPAAGQQQMGTFTGARLRVPFGGEKAGRAQIGLGIAGVARSRSLDGRSDMRFAEGAEVAFSGQRLGLSVGGQPVTRLGAQDSDNKDQAEEKDGLSTWAIVGIVAGGVVIAGGIGLALLVDAMNDASD
jgi:hypothetical protein